MEKWRFIDLDTTDLPSVHAIEETIAEGKIGNTLILWRVSKPALTIGYFQNVYEEIDVEKAKELGVPFTRRMGGGGTGYLTPKVLAYSLIVSEQSKVMPKNVEETYSVICNGVTLGLKELGLDAVHVPVNDILIGGKKFSGSSQHRSFGMIIQHGFITTELDLPTLAKLIKAPKEKLQDKGITKIEDRITWINREIEKVGREPLSLEQIKNAVKIGFEKALKVSFENSELSKEELAAAKGFKNRFELETWNINPRLYKRVNAKSIIKAPKGVIRVNAYIANGKILEVMITGDYMMHPIEAITSLEAMLAGAKTEEHAVRKIVDDFYTKESVTTPGASPGDFVKAIMETIGNLA